MIIINQKLTESCGPEWNVQDPEEKMDLDICSCLKVKSTQNAVLSAFCAASR